MPLTGKLRKLYDYFFFRSGSLIIEPTNKCNLSCPVCFHSRCSGTLVPEGFMEPALFDEILAKCAGSVKSISLHFRGEPLLHPGLAAFIALCKQRSFHVCVTTNGTLLDEGLMKELVMAGLDRLTIDYDDIAENDYEAIRGVKGAGAILEKIAALQALKDRLGRSSPEIVVKALNRGHEIKAVAAYLKRLRQRGISGKAEISDCFPWPNMKMNVDFPCAPAARPRVCGMFYQPLALTWQGTILPCSYDYAQEGSLGNIRDFKNLGEVYGLPAYRAFRRRLLLKQYDKQAPCRACLLPVLRLTERQYPLNQPAGGGRA